MFVVKDFVEPCIWQQQNSVHGCPGLQIFSVPRPTTQLTARHAGHLGTDDADHGDIHTVPDLPLSRMPSNPSSTAVSTPCGSVLALSPFTTPTKTEDTSITVAPTAIAQPPAATASTTAEATAGTPPAAPAPARPPSPPVAREISNYRRAAPPQREPAKKAQKLDATAKRAPKPKAKSAPKLKTKAKSAPKPKAKAKTAPKPKTNAKTVLKSNAKAKFVLQATTKQGLKPTTTKQSALPSKPLARRFRPIIWGPCTIYHGGKQRKYRLKEYYGSRRTKSFNDWQKMMTYIRTL